MAQTYPTRGGAALLAYVRAHHGSIPAFCETSGLDRLKVQRAINGEIKRVDVAFAEAVEDATSGEVGWRMWVPDEATRMAERKRRSAAMRAVHAERQAKADLPTEVA